MSHYSGLQKERLVALWGNTLMALPPLKLVWCCLTFQKITLGENPPLQCILGDVQSRFNKTAIFQTARYCVSHILSETAPTPPSHHTLPHKWHAVAKNSCLHILPVFCTFWRSEYVFNVYLAKHTKLTASAIFPHFTDIILAVPVTRAAFSLFLCKPIVKKRADVHW